MVAALPGVIGINAAVIFLIVTSMVWNIGFGAYEAIKAIPAEFKEVAGVFQLSPLERLRKIIDTGGDAEGHRAVSAVLVDRPVLPGHQRDILGRARRSTRSGTG